MSPHDALVRAALARQEDERADGFGLHNAPLTALRDQLDADELLGLIDQLRAGGLPDRELAARLLAHGHLHFDLVTAAVYRALESETEPQVIAWLVWALAFAADPSSLTVLKLLSKHPDAEVRFPVPDAFSACAREFSEIADHMITLSRDGDRDVRWSAAFELAAWLDNEPPPLESDRIIQRLSEFATTDPDLEIRSLAQERLQP